MASGSARRGELGRSLERGNSRLERPVELLQPLRRLLVGRRERDDADAQTLVEPEVRVVEAEEADLRMQGSLQAAFHADDVVALPHRGELRRGPMEAIDERSPRWIVDALGHGGSILGDHATDRLVPIHDHLVPPRVGEREPEAVAVLERHRLEVVEEARVDAVERQQVEAGVEDGGRIRLELLDEQPRGRAEGVALVRDGRDRRESREREEVSVLMRVELQRSRDCVEHLWRRVDVASLLEPRVPRHADTGELSDLLAPESGRAAPSRRR
jgi:hypothetical protein